MTGKQFSASRKLGKTHQNILVFIKGDGKKAKLAGLRTCCECRTRARSEKKTLLSSTQLSAYWPILGLLQLGVLS